MHKVFMVYNDIIQDAHFEHRIKAISTEVWLSKGIFFILYIMMCNANLQLK